MSNKRYKDFDAAKEARDDSPIIVKVNGEEIEFPPFLSAEVVLNQMTWLGEDGSLSASNLPLWFSSVFGKENLEKIQSKVDFQTLQDISQFLLDAYGLGSSVATQQVEVENDEEGDSPKA